MAQARRLRNWAIAVTAAATWACAHGGQPDIATLSSNSDKLIWETGKKAADKRQWESARQHFKRLIDGFPQSEYAPQARLALADSYFEEGGDSNYVLAVEKYREFLTVYPSHPRSDYAQFQTAESYFLQRHPPDRDQTATTHALEEYQRLLEVYPRSSLVERDRGRISECRHSLARAEFLTGFFYQRTRKACRAAIVRYQNVLKEYPDYRDSDEVLFRLSECLVDTGRVAEALPQLDQLTKQYPQSSYANAARNLMTTLSKGPTSSPPAVPSATPAPSPPPEAAGPDKLK